MSSFKFISGLGSITGFVPKLELKFNAASSFDVNSCFGSVTSILITGSFFIGLSSKL